MSAPGFSHYPVQVPALPTEGAGEIDGLADAPLDPIPDRFGRREESGRGYEGALPLPGGEHTLLLELGVGSLNGDHADRELGRKHANGRELRPRSPVPDGDEPLHLIHDLEVERTVAVLSDDEATVHTNIHSNPIGSSCQRFGGAGKIVLPSFEVFPPTARAGCRSAREENYGDDAPF